MDKIIVMYNNEDKVLNMSLYEFVKEQYKCGKKFIVCNITNDEYKEMIKQIKNGCLQERLPRTTKDSLSYNKFRYMIAYDTCHDNILFCDYDNIDTKGSYIMNNEKIIYEKNAVKFPKDIINSRYLGGLKVYTTESYSDVISYYQESLFSEIVEKNDKIKILKKI